MLAEHQQRVHDELSDALGTLDQRERNEEPCVGDVDQEFAGHSGGSVDRCRGGRWNLRELYRGSSRLRPCPSSPHSVSSSSLAD